MRKNESITVKGKELTIKPDEGFNNMTCNLFLFCLSHMQLDY
jgi:hypothetical protein